MGSVTIHLLVEKSLTTAGVSTENDDDDFHFESMSHILAADSSLAEVMDLVEVNLFTNEQKLQNITILDLSYNPVKNISSIVRLNTEQSGPMSKTLQFMNWYPSGKLCILPNPARKTDTDIEKGDEVMLQRFLKWQSRNVVQDEDFAYNNPTIQNQHFVAPISKEGVQWIGVGADKHETQQVMKPSEIFSAVSNRADNDHTHQDEQDEQKKPPAKKKRSEKQRTQRLDALIQDLAQSTSKDGKKKRVSDKVRTMLIKSRADGNKKLRMEDRFHLEVRRLIDDGDMSASNTAASNETAATTTSYNFFSRVTTAGRVASTVSGSIDKNKSVEFLVSFKNNKNYRRLPNTMSLHDAQQAGWLQEFDAVVIRTFPLERDDEFGQSKSVLDPESDVDSENEAEAMELESRSITSSTGTSLTDKDVGVCNTEVDVQDDHLQQRLHMIYNMTTSAEKSTKKKKPVSKQVQRMLMKSKSTGNKGIKPDDRVHLDTVIFHDDGSENIDGAYSTSFRFFSKRLSVENLVSSFQDETAQNVEILVSQPCETSSMGCVYRNLPPSKLTLEEAVKQGLLEDFGRIIVRLTSSDCPGNVPPL
jgi:hypothetical protein